MLTPRLASVGAVVALVCLYWWSSLDPARTVAAAGQQPDFVPVTDEMLRDPDPADWLMIHRTYDFQSFSPLDQINRDNVDSYVWRGCARWMKARKRSGRSCTTA